MEPTHGNSAVTTSSRPDDVGQHLGGAQLFAGVGTVPSMIPGAYERKTPTPRQPGSMGGGAFGAGAVPNVGSTLDAETILEREKEGGGGTSQRPHPHRTQPVSTASELR